MPGPIHVRRLRASDLDRIVEIEHASFGKDAYDRNLFAEYHRKCGELFLVALEAHRICGYAVTCTRADGRSAELISIAIDPKRRKKGVASLLLRSTIRRLRRRGVPRVTLMVKVTNRAARRFYEKWGFERTRLVKGYYEDGRDGLRMEAEV